MISVVGLCKSFSAPNGERIDVLRDVTFSAQLGESIAITGASGSGKSTLLHVLGGLETADHGTITFSESNGRHLQQIGFVFQFHYLLPDLSALENVALPLLIARHNKKRTMDFAMKFLKEVGLEARADHPVTHLSGGEQQRVAVARAMITRPKLLLADEPTGNLDEAISAEIGQTLVDYARKNAAVTLIATHSPMLAKMCDRSLTLEAGRFKSV